jgi:hypothetical protein
VALTVTPEEIKAREDEIRTLLHEWGFKRIQVQTLKSLLNRVEARVVTAVLDAADLRKLLEAGLRMIDLAQMGDIYVLTFDSALTRKEAAAATAVFAAQKHD